MKLRNTFLWMNSFVSEVSFNERERRLLLSGDPYDDGCWFMSRLLFVRSDRLGRQGWRQLSLTFHFAI